MKSFHNQNVRFAVDIPDHWHFLPTAWSPSDKQRRNSTSGADAALMNTPFCFAMADHQDNGVRAVPTLQATCRPFVMPAPSVAGQLLDGLVGACERAYEDATIELATADGVIAGFPALIIRISGRVEVATGGQRTRVPAIGRVHCVFARGLSYTIGLASSDDPSHYDESELTGILRSIRIGS